MKCATTVSLFAAPGAGILGLFLGKKCQKKRKEDKTIIPEAKNLYAKVPGNWKQCVLKYTGI